MAEHKCYLQEDDPPEQHDLSHYSCVCGACYAALADLERAATAQRDAALAERDGLAAQVAVMREALVAAHAAMWDGHYGKGIAVEYAQSVQKQCDAALSGTAANALLAERDGLRAEVERLRLELAKEWSP